MRKKEALGISTTPLLKRNFWEAAKRRQIKNSDFFEIILEEFLKKGNEFYEFMGDDEIYNLPSLRGVTKREALKVFCPQIKNCQFENDILNLSGKELKVSDLDKVLNEEDVLNLKEYLFKLKKDALMEDEPLTIEFLKEVKGKYKFYPAYDIEDKDFIIFPEKGATFSEPLRFKNGISKRAFLKAIEKEI